LWWSVRSALALHSRTYLLHRQLEADTKGLKRFGQAVI